MPMTEVFIIEIEETRFISFTKGELFYSKKKKKLKTWHWNIFGIFLDRGMWNCETDKQ